jgi:hypothetical protein
MPEPLRPVASFRRTAMRSIITAEDRLRGLEESDAPTTAAMEPPKGSEGPKSPQKQGAFVAVGGMMLKAVRAVVCCPSPRERGSSEWAHDAINLVFMLFAAYVSLDYIYYDRDTVWQAVVCTLYFVVDVFWIAWDPDCVKQ